MARFLSLAAIFACVDAQLAHEELKNSQELLPSRDEGPRRLFMSYLEHPVVHITGLSVLGALALGCVGAIGYLIYGRAAFNRGFTITPLWQVDITIYSVMEAVSVGLVGVIGYMMYEEIYFWMGSDAKLMEADGTESVKGDDVADEENMEADAVAGDDKNTTSTKAPSTDGKPPLSSADGNSAMSYGISVVALLMALCF